MAKVKTVSSKEPEEVSLNFYEFDQNNSGGSFDVTDKLCHRLIIQASSEKEAIRIAEDMGVYFDGCEKGIDCDCCGDRWYSSSLIEIPKRYGTFTSEQANSIAGEYAIVEATNFKGRPIVKNGDRGFDVFFDDVVKYAQYLTDSYGGWTSPDCRIFYKDGTVKEIYSSRIEEYSKKKKNK